jgi:hypothetical protein
MKAPGTIAIEFSYQPERNCMHTVRVLTTFREQAAAAISRLENIVFPLERKVEEIQNDETVGPREREARIRIERQKIEAQIIELVKQVQAASAEVAAQRKFWSSPTLVLAQQRFSEIPSSDAQVKSWHASRLARLPLPQLALEYQHALSTGDFPLVGLILTERAGRNVAPAQLDAKDFSLAGVAIPGQAEALGALDGIASDSEYATLLFRSSRGTKIAASEKMSLARADPARKPSAQPHTAGTVRDDLAATQAARAAANQPGLD